MGTFDEKAWKRAYNRDWMRRRRADLKDPGGKWRRLAEDARAKAEAAMDAGTREKLLKIAEDYEALSAGNKDADDL